MTKINTLLQFTIVLLIFSLSFLPAQTFAATAVGQIVSMTVSEQTGTTTYGVPGSVTYSLRALGNATFVANWSVINLPVGVTGYFSATSSLGSGFWTTDLTLVNSPTAPDPGTYGFAVQVTRDGTSNFLFKNANYKIDKKPIDPSLIVVSKLYDATTNASSTCEFPGRVGSDDIVCSVSDSEFLDPNASTSVVVNGEGISMSGTHSNKYILNSNTATATAPIVQKDQVVTLSIATPTNAVYGDADIPLSSLILLATSTSGIPPVISGGLACTIIEGKLHFTRGATYCDISAGVYNDNYINGLATNNYRNAKATTRFYVDRKAQNLTSFFEVPTESEYGQADIDLKDMVISDSGLDVDLTATGACNFVSTAILRLNKGSQNCSIFIKQKGNLQYAPSNKITIIFKVNRKAQMITQNLEFPPKLTKGQKIDLKNHVSSNSDERILFSASGACSLEIDELVLANKIGTCSLIYKQKGTSQYLPSNIIIKNIPVRSS